jgi:hypothetical protein
MTIPKPIDSNIKNELEFLDTGFAKMESRIIDNILNSVKGIDVDFALNILDSCKDLILNFSVVSYPWDRLEQKENSK